MRTGKAIGRTGRLAAFVGGLAALAGCTSLLGDFATGSGSDDGGTDATTQGGDGQANADGSGAEVGNGGDDVANDVVATDGGDASDAPVDAPAGPLNCGAWVYAQPVVLDTLSTGTRRVSGPLTVYTLPVPGSPDTVRVVAGKNGPKPFSVYSLDRSPSDAGPVVTSLSPSASYFASSMAAVHRSAGAASAFTVVLSSTQSTASASATYVAYVLQDSLPATGPVPNPFTVYQLAATQSPPLSIHILPFQTTELFAAIEYSASGGTTYNLGAGIATGASPITTLSPVASSVYLDDFTRSAMFHSSVSNTVYVYATNDIQTPGLSSWAVPDTLPADAAAPQKRAVSALASAIRDISENLANTTVPSANIAYEEQVPNASNPNITSKVTYYAGAVPNSGATPSLDSWAPTDLSVVKSYANAAVFDAPFAPPGFTPGSIWAKDNIMLLGPGFKVSSNVDASNGGVPYGLNLLWEDATGTLKSAMSGSGRLLPNLADITGAAATPIALGGMGRPPRWAVVWVETKTDDAGQYDVISYNELLCQ